MIKKTFNHSVGVTGEARFTRLIDGKKMIQKNTVTNVGLSELAYSLIDKSRPQFYFAIGDDDTNVTPDQIALQTEMESEVARNIADTVSVELDIDQNYIYNVESVFTLTINPTLNTDPATSIKELGLFNRFVEGQMLARAQTSAPFLMDFQSEFQGEWTIKPSVPNFIDNGIVYDGSRIVCNALMKIDKEVDNSNQYYDAGGAPAKAFTPAPWGLNIITIGKSGNPSSIDMKDLIEPMVDYDTPPTITRLDLTGEASDTEYEAKVIIQKYIPINTVPFIIKEVGLFNQRDRRIIGKENVRDRIKLMFSRVVLDVPIPANAECVLSWVIGFKRGS